MDSLIMLFGAGEIGRSKAFWKRNLILIIGVTVLDVSAKTLLGGLLMLSQNQKLIIIALTYFIPLLINSIFFVIYRYPTLGIRFSKKTNLVFAYNLEGINEEKFLKKYNALISDVRNEIDSKNLGKKVIVKVAPSDIRLRENSAAEAMVLLGLEGSTLFVWGHAVRSNGKIKFVTKFSYEFGHKKDKGLEQAKDEIGSYIQKIMNRGLFSSLKMDPAHFREQTIPTVFFILGLTTLTLRLPKKAEEFLLAFKDIYREVDIVRKRDLGPALLECDDMLVSIYQANLSYISSDLTETERADTLVLIKKILEIKPKDYTVNIQAAYLYDLMGERDLAQQYNNAAEKYAPMKENAHLFNRAYFALQEDNYSAAIDFYDSIPDELNVNPADISNYLNKKYKETSNPVFLFGDSYVSLRWGDKVTGMKSLEAFIAIANPTTHILLIDKLRTLSTT